MYNIEVKYKPGQINRCGGALSRCPGNVTTAELNVKGPDMLPSNYRGSLMNLIGHLSYSTGQKKRSNLLGYLVGI